MDVKLTLKRTYNEIKTDEEIGGRCVYGEGACTKPAGGGTLGRSPPDQ